VAEQLPSCAAQLDNLLKVAPQLGLARDQIEEFVKIEDAITIPVGGAKDGCELVLLGGVHASVRRTRRPRRASLPSVQRDHLAELGEAEPAITVSVSSDECRIASERCSRISLFHALLMASSISGSPLCSMASITSELAVR